MPELSDWLRLHKSALLKMRASTALPLVSDHVNLDSSTVPVVGRKKNIP